MPLWQRYNSAEGAPYYYNTETEETTWDAPEGFDHAAADAADAAEGKSQFIVLLRCQCPQ